MEVIMSAKAFYKFARTGHRFLAYPTFVLIPAMIILRMKGSGNAVEMSGPLFVAQSVLMMGLVLTGAGLFILPKIISGNAKKKQAKKTES